MNHNLPNNEATRSALKASSDQELRVACYCEENVYRLVYRKLAAAAAAAVQEERHPDCRYYVVFVSSETQCVPMFYQKAAPTPTSACLWDYHVVLLQVNDEKTSLMLDMDSYLPYPCALDTYIEHSFPARPENNNNNDCSNNNNNNNADDHAPLFRVVQGDTFLRTFCSDRLHMFQNGQWTAPPPTYACIGRGAAATATATATAGGSNSNLDSYRIMTIMKQQCDNNNGEDDDDDEHQSEATTTTATPTTATPTITAISTKEEMEMSFQSDFGTVLNEKELLHYFRPKQA